MLSLVTAATVALITGSAIPGAADLTAGVGAAEHGVLSMRFEVTFMKIDVADVEALLTTADAARVEAVAAGERTGEAEAEVEAILAGADPVVVAMRYVRDASFGRFTKGMASGIDAAHEGDQLSDAERRSVHDQFLVGLTPMEERGVKEGDTLVFRVEGNAVTMRVVDATGQRLAEASYEGDVYPRAVRGMYICCKSDFLEKLVRSAFED